MMSATQPLTLKVRSIPCEVIKGNFFNLQDLTQEQKAAALAKFRGPLEGYLYLIAIDDQRVITRQHVSSFSSAERVAVGAV